MRCHSFIKIAGSFKCAAISKNQGVFAHVNAAYGIVAVYIVKLVVGTVVKHSQQFERIFFCKSI